MATLLIRFLQTFTIPILHFDNKLPTNKVKPKPQNNSGKVRS